MREKECRICGEDELHCACDEEVRLKKLFLFSLRHLEQKPTPPSDPEGVAARAVARVSCGAMAKRGTECFSDLCEQVRELL